MASDEEAGDAAVIYDDVVRVSETRSPTLPDLAENPDLPAGRATLADVARLADVSPITVSRALRQPGMVSADKRQRVQRAVEQTGYRINPYASMLKSGRSNIVLAFASNLMSEQFSLALQACAGVFEEAGYLFLMGQTSYSYERETAAIQSLQAIKPAAVMFTGVIELEANREALRGLDIPIMETWALPRDPIDMLVGFSNTEAGQRAAEILFSKGHRKVAYIGRRGGRGRLRQQGFRRKCDELGMAIVREVLVDEVTAPSQGRACLAAVIRESEIDAVFCSNDVLALGCLMEARRLGIPIPGGLGILGFGESDIAAEIPPGLTTIGIDSAGLGREAGEMLLGRLSGETVEPKVRRMDLVVRSRGSV